MRLSPELVDLIRRTTREVFGEHACVTVFGSRVDDAARGGDLDLLVTMPSDRPDRFAKAGLVTAC